MYTRRNRWKSKTEEKRELKKEQLQKKCFFTVKKRFIASSMWTKYFMIKPNLKVQKGGSGISRYGKLHILFHTSRRKQRYWTKTQIETFLKKAPDKEYLQAKI